MVGDSWITGFPFNINFNNQYALWASRVIILNFHDTSSSGSLTINYFIYYFGKYYFIQLVKMRLFPHLTVNNLFVYNG